MSWSQIWAECKDTLKSNETNHRAHLTYASCRKKFAQMAVFFEVADFFVLDMCSKPILCSENYSCTERENLLEI